MFCVILIQRDIIKAQNSLMLTTLCATQQEKMCLEGYNTSPDKSVYRPIKLKKKKKIVGERGKVCVRNNEKLVTWNTWSTNHSLEHVLSIPLPYTDW